MLIPAGPTVVLGATDPAPANDNTSVPATEAAKPEAPVETTAAPAADQPAATPTTTKELAAAIRLKRHADRAERAAEAKRAEAQAAQAEYADLVAAGKAKDASKLLDAIEKQFGMPFDQIVVDLANGGKLTQRDPVREELDTLKAKLTAREEADAKAAAARQAEAAARAEAEGMAEVKRILDSSDFELCRQLGNGAVKQAVALITSAFARATEANGGVEPEIDHADFVEATKRAFAQVEAGLEADIEKVASTGKFKSKFSAIQTAEPAPKIAAARSTTTITNKLTGGPSVGSAQSKRDYSRVMSRSEAIKRALAEVGQS